MFLNENELVQFIKKTVRKKFLSVKKSEDNKKIVVEYNMSGPDQSILDRGGTLIKSLPIVLDNYKLLKETVSLEMSAGKLTSMRNINIPISTLVKELKKSLKMKYDKNEFENSENNLSVIEDDMSDVGVSIAHLLLAI